MSEQLTGTVKWYNPEKAYGFISTADDRDIFVHRNAIADGRPWLVDGQQVSLRIRQGMKGPEAEDVRVTQDVEGIPPSRARFYGGEGRSESRGERSFARGERYDSRPRRDDGPRRPRESYRGPIPSGPVAATVIRVDPAGRFMFVRVDEYGFDAYVHSSLFRQLRMDPREGDTVRVTVEESDRGLRASTIESV
jgi:cold shock CspA family protein